VSLYKRGGVYWYHFIFNGRHFQETTKQGNPRVARQMEAAHRTSLAKGEVGLRERKPAPRLRDFAKRFLDEINIQCGAKPRTVRFYAEKMTRLLEFEPLAVASLDDIDEAAISAYIQVRKREVSPASVNRELATLRRLLRLAYEWKIINRVPRIRLLQGERSREFILTYPQEGTYLGAAPQPLRDVALLLLDTGLRVGEAVALRWSDIRLRPVNGARYGLLHVREGKSKNAKRNVPLTARISQMLERRSAQNRSLLVFPGSSGDRPLLVTSLDHEHAKLRALLRMPDDFVLHCLRHTMLTRLGESGVDAFTIMRIAGHSSVTISQRYVHPSPEAVERAFDKLETLNKGAEEGLACASSNRLIPATVSATVAESVPVSTRGARSSAG
jgi:integrase